MACLYKIDFPSGKGYIGVTVKDPGERLKEHVRASKRESSYAIHRAIRKYGSDNCVLRTLLIGDIEFCKKMEIEAIREYETLLPNGYNSTSGGDGFYGLSQEVIDRRSESIRDVYKDPEKLAERRAFLDALRNDEEIESRRIESTRAYHRENRQELADRLAALKMRPGFEENRKSKLAIALSDEDYRRKNGERARIENNKPHVKKKISESSKARWQDPGHREKVKSSFEDRRKAGLLSKNYIYENKSGTFSVKIRHNGSNVHLGTHKSYEDAVNVRDNFLKGVGR